MCVSTTDPPAIRRTQSTGVTRSSMNMAKSAAIIQEQFDRQSRESFSEVVIPRTLALELVITTWRSAGDLLARRHGANPQPFTLAAMALLHGATTSAFATTASVQAYFVRALFQLTRNLDELSLPALDRELIDRTLDAASDLAPQWFPRKKP
jgi:hypothetical protein